MLISILILAIYITADVLWFIRGMRIRKQGFLNSDPDLLARAGFEVSKAGPLNLVYGILGLTYSLSIPGGRLTSIVFTVIGAALSSILIAIIICNKDKTPGQSDKLTYHETINTATDLDVDSMHMSKKLSNECVDLQNIARQ